jgi:hypothetical protein
MDDETAKELGLRSPAVKYSTLQWEYQAVEAHYGDRRAERTGVPYMNHIDEGLAIIEWMGLGPLAAQVFCLHPLFQNDEDFRRTLENPSVFADLNPLAIAGALEYRHTANAHLAKHPPRAPKLSVMDAVNKALIADKIQNRKDFEKYHLGTHPNSDRLAAYFREWLNVLRVSEGEYRDLVARLGEKRCVC